MAQLNQKQIPQNNPMQLINEFQKFAKGMTPEKAKQIIEQKIQNGEISSQQFEQMKQQAIQFSKMFNIK